jgi:hypothetical protein
VIRILSWFSCGAASAVATKLALAEHIYVTPVYCDTGAEHPDNRRFLKDCEIWFGDPVIILHSERYADTWDVFERRRYLAGVEGALCTVEMKVMPRLEFQRPDDVHVFGYTADAADVSRAQRLRANYPELTIETPLIERGLTKKACLALLDRAGVPPPAMYALGFTNNNCIPCVKATSPNYWALVRQKFPLEFERMAKLARELNVRLCRIKNVRRFIDEIPENWPTNNPIAPACDFLCHLAAPDLEDVV